MKKIQTMAYAGAIALLSTGFAACTSEDDVTEKANPTYDPVANTVTTQFVLNVSTAQQQTRMDATAVQVSGFRGIDNVHLLPYTLDYNVGTNGGGSHMYKVDNDAHAIASRDYDLGRAMQSGEISETNAKRIFEITLPVGTNTLMFYGKAIRPTTTYDANDYGKITYSVAKDARNTSFSLVSRYSDYTSRYTQCCNLIATVLSRISSTGLHQESSSDSYNSKVAQDLRYAFWWPISTASQSFETREGGNATGAPLYANNYVGTATDAISSTETEDHTGYTFMTGTKEWSDYGTAYDFNHDENTSNDVEMKPMEEIMGEAYSRFTTINAKELRGGSSEAVLSTMHDLYDVITKVATGTPTGMEEYIAQQLAVILRARMQKYFDPSGASFAWQSLANLKTNIEANVRNISSSSFNAITADTHLSKFPESCELPLGASLITYTPATKTWSYLQEIPNYDLGGLSSSTTTLDKYNYPAELCYFGNSPVRVSDSQHENVDYPSTVNKWDSDSEWASDWTGNASVKSTNLSVAMQKSVNYGTALLKSTVRYGAATINDNNAAIHPGESDNAIAASEGAFQVTGVLVAGLPKTVGWNYIKKKADSSDGDYSQMVYDKNNTDNRNLKAYTGNANTDKSCEMYTLVWDTYNADKAANAQDPVFVAVEFKNNTGKNLWAEANMIRAGGTFYIIGKLDPTDKDFPAHSNSIYNLPPYNADGTTVEATRPFIQDYMTTADFVLGVESLKKAYVTVPDLRSSQISLGLAVDLKWETGVSFENILLGQ